MKKLISAIMSVALVFVAVFSVPVLAVGNEKTITNADELAQAILNQQDGETWILQEGTYNLSQEQLDVYKDHTFYGRKGWYFPIEKSITIKGQGNVVITSDVKTTNGNWQTQNFITVMADNVSIENVDIKSKTEANKAIEVLGKNFSLNNVNILRTEDFNSGSLYFNPQNPEKSVGNVELSRVTVAQWTQKSRVKAEKTKIFFQKASSGFGDVSFKERSGRFKA